MRRERASVRREQTTSSPEHIPFPVTIDERRARDGYARAEPRFRERGDKTRVIFYEETLTPETTYLVYRFDDRWDFQLIHQGKKVGNMVFREVPWALSLEHRRVESQGIGVTGTMFLQKAEAYLSFLRQQGVLDDRKSLMLNAGQKDVVLWALKNGFAFDPPEQSGLFKAIVDGAPDYVVDVDDLPEEDGYVRKGYIVPKADYEQWKKDCLERSGLGHEPIHAGRVAKRFQLVKVSAT